MNDSNENKTENKKRIRRSKDAIDKNKSNPELLLFSSNLKRIKEEKKLSIQSISDVSGLSNTLIHELLHSISTPSFYTIIKLSEALSIHPSILFLDDRYNNIIDLIQNIYLDTEN